MGVPAAKEGDSIVGVDTHVVMVPSPGGPVPTPMPLPFSGKLSGDLAGTVFVANKQAAVKGSTAQNNPSHTAPAGPFQTPPSNKGTVQEGSATVFFANKAAARMGDPAMTCNDPSDAPVGSVIASGSVFVG
ncbi:MAG: PAAR domain-containing protein [Polyangiaceae bacterium]